eukprot:g8460.t1
MSFPSKTRHFSLQYVTRDETVLVNLLVKQNVKVIRTSEVISIKTNSDQELGCLELSALEDYHPNVQFDGFIRSIVRGPNQSIAAIHVTVSPRKREQDPLEVPRWELETREHGWLLKQQHYEALVANEQIRTKLRNQELQKILKSVDSAQNKETALHTAFEGTETMHSFLMEVLSILNVSQTPLRDTTASKH